MNRRLAAAILALAAGPIAAFTAHAEDESKSLYERLGGLRSITPVIEDFVDRLYANPTLQENPAVYASQRSTPPSYLKFQFAQLVCEMSGGPCVYAGPTMKQAHQRLHLDAEEWQVMADELKKTLEKFSVPAAERMELLELLGQTQGDIIEKADVAAVE